MGWNLSFDIFPFHTHRQLLHTGRVFLSAIFHLESELSPMCTICFSWVPELFRGTFLWTNSIMLISCSVCAFSFPCLEMWFDDGDFLNVMTHSERWQCFKFTSLQSAPQSAVTHVAVRFMLCRFAVLNSAEHKCTSVWTSASPANIHFHFYLPKPNTPRTN